MIPTLGADAVLVDTNVLVYAHDIAAGDKHLSAARQLTKLVAEGRLAVSAQVLNELYNSLTHPKKKVRLPHAQAATIVQNVARACTVFPLTQQITLRALDVVSRHSISFWDALIWAAAKENGVGTVYTEDFQHGRDLDGVRFVNPSVQTM